MPQNHTLSFDDLTALPPIEADHLWSRGSPDGVCFETTQASRAFFRYAPAFIDDPDGTDTFEGLGTDVYRSPAPLVAALSDCMVVGYRTIISNGKFYRDQVLTSRPEITEYLEAMASEDSFFNEDTGLRRIGTTRRFHLNTEDRPARIIDDEVIILCSTEPSNYGSFIFRVLPKLATLKRLGCPDLPVLVYADDPYVDQYLELAGISSDRIIRHQTYATTYAPRAIVPSLRNPDCFFDYETRQLFADIRQAHGSPQQDRMIYISRLGFGTQSDGDRVMQNEAELIDRLSQFGFTIVQPQDLSVAEQIEMYSSASLVVGPAGSGMFNCAFCHPGTKIIDIESEPHWIYAHTGLFASSELDYGIFVGQVDETDETPVHRRWSVNIEALMDRIESLV